MIMSDRNEGLVQGVPLVFGADNHSYCVRHLIENLLKEAARLGIRRNASKDLIKEMFNRIAYATTGPEYDSAMEELRKFRRELAVWVERNDPHHWAQSKFSKDRWGKLNNNPIESWNNWMRKLRVMSIPWLVLGHLQKVGVKWDKRKAEMQKWANNVGDRIEKKLKKELAHADSVIEVQAYNRSTGEFSVQLSNSHRLVVTLSKGECSCRWWQIKGFPCRHGMTVIRKEKKWVYDYVNVCYKSGTQRLCYMNTVHPMETHDMGSVDDRTGRVTGGDGLDDNFNRRILPPINPRKRSRPKSTRRESQTQGVRTNTCSKCHEPGHKRTTCRNPRADVDADYEGDLVLVEDLLGGNG